MPLPQDILRLLTDFTRVRPEGDELVLEVASISWHLGPHTPSSRWHEVERLPSDTPSDRVKERRRRLLSLRRFFRRCEFCDERNPCGWMLDATCCQQCGSERFGVVY